MGSRNLLDKRECYPDLRIVVDAVWKVDHQMRLASLSLLWHSDIVRSTVWNPLSETTAEIIYGKCGFALTLHHGRKRRKPT